MEISINQNQLESICSVFGDTENGFTKSELSRFLVQCGIDNNEYSSNMNRNDVKLSKKKYLFNCFSKYINENQSTKSIWMFIEKALDPVLFTKFDLREKYIFLKEGVNRVLLLMGYYINNEGKLELVEKATSLDQVDRRVNQLKRNLKIRNIHHEVEKYCINDYLRSDYYDAVFEASKSLSVRVRELTGLEYDGSKLFETAFSRNNPYIIFNFLRTESEINEYNGLKELLLSITHLVRNPAAHTPKIDWVSNESKVLDILTLISFAHKYLDECSKVSVTEGMNS